MARRLAGITLSAIGVLAPTGAAAQPAPANARESVELTAFYGARTGGSFIDSSGRIVGVDGASSFGGLADVDLRRHDLKLELLFSRQQNELAAAMVGVGVLDAWMMLAVVVLVFAVHSALAIGATALFRASGAASGGT